MKEVLLLCNRRPDPTGSGDAKIGYQTLQALLDRGDRVALVVTDGGQRGARDGVRAIAGAIRGLPLQIGLTNDSTGTDEVATLIRNTRFDLVVAIHARALLKVPPTMRRRTLAIIIDAYGKSYSSYLPYVSLPRKLLYAFEARRMERFERWVCRAFGATALVAQSDVAHLQTGACSKLTRLPYAVDLDYFVEPAHSSRVTAPTIVMIGRLNYAPNTDAAQYFMRDIGPILRSSQPDIRMIIAGARPPKRLIAMAAGAKVELHADVADVRTVLAKATVAIAPVRFGAGVQTKVLEAMAAGVPVVASEFANQGLTADPDRNILIANTPTEYARQIGRLIVDKAMAESIKANALRFVRTKHSPAAFRRHLIEACEAVEDP